MSFAESAPYRNAYQGETEKGALLVVKSKLLALLFAILACGVAGAKEFSVGPLRLTVPEGFQGPIRQDEGAATVVGFSKPRADARANTLLQISIYDAGEGVEPLPDAERAAAATKYLLEFLGGVERQRTGFKRTTPEVIEIDGIPAARTTWTGRISGRAVDAVGVMYCVVVGSSVISFHTQDLGSTPTSAMQDAMRAFESVRFDEASKR
jgi:hypothetical protein